MAIDKTKEHKIDGSEHVKNKDDKEQAKIVYDDGRVITVTDCMRSESNEYTEGFQDIWQDIHRQLNFQFPQSWLNAKETWMAKFFVGLQTKISEGAYAVIMDMCFGQNKNFFSVVGHQQIDHELETNLSKFLRILLDMGGFHIENQFTVKESSDLGTSFLKVLVDPDKKKRRLDFQWRSIKNVGFDISAITNFNKHCDYFFESDTLHMDTILDNDKISQEKKDELLLYYDGKMGDSKEDGFEQIYQLSDGGEIKLSKKYQTVPVEEWIVNFPQEYEKEVEDDAGNKQMVKFIRREPRIILIADSKIVLRNSKSEYGCLNVCRARLKRASDSPMGDGFLKGTIKCADVSNSLASSMIDGTKMSITNMYRLDEQSIKGKFKVKPWGKIKMKSGKFGDFDVINMANPKISEAINVMLFIEQVSQEISAITRDIGGNPSVGSQEDQTLGQTQLKMQTASRKLLRIAFDFTDDYMIPLLRMILTIITQDEFIDMFQELANDTIGYHDKEIPNPQVQRDLKRGATKTAKTEKVPKLVLKRVKELDLNFTPLALLDFKEKADQYNKLISMIQLGVQNSPVFAQSFFEKMDASGAFERWIAMTGITDPDALIKDEKELKQEQAQKTSAIAQGLSNQGGPGGQTPSLNQGGLNKRDIVPSQPSTAGVPNA